MRELIPDWGWSRWTSARSSINVNLRLRGHVRYTFFLLLLDAMNPNSLDEIEVYLANKMIQLSFVPDGTNWRGFADILVPGDVLIDKITLTIPNPVRPCDSGLGDDRRLLGVRVKSLMIIA